MPAGGAVDQRLIAEPAKGADRQVRACELAAQSSDIELDGVRAGLGVETEYPREELLLLQHAAAIDQEYLEEHLLAAGEFARAAIDGDGARGHVEPKVAGLEHPPVLAAAPADDGAGAGLQFAEIERLDHVVVSPFVERRYLVVHRQPRRQHQNRGGVALDTQPAQEPGSRAVRQIDVENDQVIGRQRGKVPGIGDGRRVVAGMTGADEAVDDRLGDIERVFDHEEMHGLTLSPNLTAT